MKLLIAGGKLQGVEASYLAQKCGFETILIDKDNLVPAKNFCTRFIQMDIFNKEQLSLLLNEIDIVIPALENQETLDELSASCKIAGVPLLFSNDAYTISSSKIKSNFLFQKLELPIPKAWPDCNFPVILKPSRGSGSNGVRIFRNEEDLQSFLSGRQPKSEVIIEEHVEGKQYSLEIIGLNLSYKCLQITELEMDDTFDCKRVIAPSGLPSKAVAALENIAHVTAEAIGLKGIMDIEVVYSNGEFKILEIDARLPSQTPIAVFWSTGFNIIENMVLSYQGKPMKMMYPFPQAVVLEHIKISGDTLEICGEHIIADADDLQIYDNFFGADEALGNYQEGNNDWVATIIITGENRKAAMLKRTEVIERIINQFEICNYQDLSPTLREHMSNTGILAYV